MRTLFGKLESPAVTNLTATFSGARSDATPAVLPDLYRGEPLALAAKMSALAGTLEVKGTIGDQPWIVTLPIAAAAEGRGLSKLWARRKIAAAEVARTLRQIMPEEADRRILALALEHHLVTRLTSLVAVDRTPSRPDGAQLTRAEIPLNLPAGWDFDKVFGGERAPVPVPEERRADADPARDVQLVAYAAVARSQKPVAPKSLIPAGQVGVTLPKTATDAELRLWLGLLLCLASLILLAMRRRWSSSVRFFP
jgi:Ca-activated chloride channel family protein